MTLTAEVKSALGSLGVHPEKRRGQHFMVTENTLSFIADSLEIKKGETVMEIGPGLGFLTAEILARGARVVAVEKDYKLAEYLGRKFSGRAIRCIEKDILKCDPKKELGLSEFFKVAGNIPYNLTSPILEWIVNHKLLIEKAVLTVQKEVAERLAAGPGTKTWGALSIFVQTNAEVTWLKKIAAGAFYPPPKVESAVVKLDFSKAPYEVSGLFSRLVRRAFQKRRKTLLNALLDEDDPTFSKKALLVVMARSDIDPRRRPETLTIPEWIRLASTWSS